MSDFAHLAADPRIRSNITGAFDRVWNPLRGPGSHFTSAEKVEIARRVRTVRNGSARASGLPRPAGEVVDRLAGAPGTIRRPWVEEMVRCGLTMPGYVEAVALVGQIVAVDGFHRVLGLPEPELPPAGQGAPTGDVNPEASRSKAYVPMTRGTSIWWSLTLVPEAHNRMEDLHCVLYLTPEQMTATGSPRSLSRPQMELVAARTSAVNECFY